jgi:hypothetical protein
MAGRRLFAGYLVVQAAAGVVWWAALLASPTLRSWFELAPGRPEVMDAFLVPDALVVMAGSLLAARAVATGSRRSGAAVAFTLGGLAYATLFILGWLAATGTGAPLLAVMVPPTVFTAWVGAHTRPRVEKGP